MFECFLNAKFAKLNRTRNFVDLQYYSMLFLFSLMVSRGGGSAKNWTSMLEKNLVWNGGSKLEKLCGTVWTQNGGEICQNLCYMGM